MLNHGVLERFHAAFFYAKNVEKFKTIASQLPLEDAAVTGTCQKLLEPLNPCLTLAVIAVNLVFLSTVLTCLE